MDEDSKIMISDFGLSRMEESGTMVSDKFEFLILCCHNLTFVNYHHSQSPAELQVT